MLDAITATDPVVLNCLIDMRGIESILIIKVSALITIVKDAHSLVFVWLKMVFLNSC